MTRALAPSHRAIAERLLARYPLLFVVHHDEMDSRRVLAGLAKAAGLQLFDAGLSGEDAIVESSAALKALTADAGPAALLLLPFGHRLLADDGFARLLTERLAAVERGGHCVVLTGPTPLLRAELERDCVVLTLGLPDEAALTPLVKAALTATDGAGPGQPLLDAAVAAVKGLTRTQVRRALRRMRLTLERGTPDEAIEALRIEKRALLEASGVLEVVDALPDLNLVGGLDELKAWLRRRSRAMRPEARAFGLPAPRGVLVVGVQGCGKSLIAKGTAGVLGLPLVRLDIGRLYTHDRAPDENLRHALAVAEAMAPVVLWLDEIDKAFAGATGGGEAAARIFGSFITWLAEHPPGVFVAATANRVDHLPAELMRKGRFDETFFVDLPQSAARAEISAIHLRRSGRDPAGFDLEAIGRVSERLTGAEIEGAIVEALAIAFEEGRQLGQADVERALEKTVPFVETYEAQVKQLREWARKRARSASSDRSLRELFVAAREERKADEPRGRGLPPGVTLRRTDDV